VTIQPAVNELLVSEGIDVVAAEELAIIPGMDEVVALARVHELGDSGAYDAVYVDAAPTGETIRLLSMPETFPWYAERLKKWGDRIPRLARPIARGMMGSDGSGLLGSADKMSTMVRDLPTRL